MDADLSSLLYTILIDIFVLLICHTIYVFGQTSESGRGREPREARTQDHVPGERLLIVPPLALLLRSLSHFLL